MNAKNYQTHQLHCALNAMVECTSLFDLLCVGADIKHLCLQDKHKEYAVLAYKQQRYAIQRTHLVVGSE